MDRHAQGHPLLRAEGGASDGIQVSFSVAEDPLFGPLVSFGLAGAPSELLGDRSYGIPPLTDLDAAGMIRNLRSAPLLYGYRGSEPVDVDALQDIVVRLAAMKDDLPEIAELDLEPVLVHGEGRHGPERPRQGCAIG